MTVAVDGSTGSRGGFGSDPGPRPDPALWPDPVLACGEQAEAGMRDCGSLAYKASYWPHQRRVGGEWTEFERAGG